MKEMFQYQLEKLINYNKFSFKNYANFKGRSSRNELVYAGITHFLIGFISTVIIDTKYVDYFFVFPYFLITFTPTLALLFRRMHDVAKKGWAPLIAIGFFVILSILMSLYNNPPVILIVGVPIFVTSFVFSILYLSKVGDQNENKYGPVTIYPNPQQQNEQ